MKKSYNLTEGVGRCKYVVTFYSGTRFNNDGSLAADMAIFKNKKKANVFVNSLICQSYTGNGLF